MALRPDRQTLLTVVDGDGHRDPGVGRGLAGGDLPGAGQDDLAHEHVVDLVGGHPARSRAAAMAKPPSSVAAKPPRAPESLPIGVRAPATMTDPDMATSAAWWPVQAASPHGPATTTGRHDTASAGVVPPGTGPTGPGSDPPSGGLSSSPMQEILSAILAGAPGDELAALPLPESYRAAFVRRDEVDMFEGMESEDKDPRKSLHVGEVATPELAPDEAYIAVMASAINFNTVWTSIFEPLPTFGFLDRLGRESVWGARHALDYHVVGSDASGVVLRVGLGRARSGSRATRSPSTATTSTTRARRAHDDSMLADNQRIWGFETNFGGLADLAVVKANQLMPKPAHLTWEEAAVNALCNSTSYRMLVSQQRRPR